MRLQEIVDILKTTELKQIVIGENDAQIISLLNLALIDVYARLNILQEEQIVRLEAGKTRYQMQDNSQRILQIYGKPKNQDEYEEIPINDIKDERSVFTPQPFVLHVPIPEDGKVLSVMHSVSPPYVTTQNITTLDFIVPPQLMEPIVNYVGYRAYKSMDGSEQTEMATHYKAYINSIKETQKLGLVHQSIMTNTKTKDRGFA